MWRVLRLENEAMSNSRRFRRQHANRPAEPHTGGLDVAAWREQQRTARAGHHGMNVWHCGTCGYNTFTIDVDPGATPMMLGCRNPQACTGTAVSAGYPAAPPPYDREPDWEWRLPTRREYQAMTPAMQEHVDSGGLALYPRESSRPSAYLPTD